jgi:ABC-2 type transport system ATP-binding protein
MQPIIATENLCKEYKGVKAVSGLTFSVSEGEIFALVGPNGAGKSTTLKMLATILRPTSGSVLIDGIDITAQGDKVRRIISYLPEEAGAYKNLTGMQYLRFMAGIMTDDSARAAAAVVFAADITGLGRRLDDKVKTYSKGMTRKLLLARAVMCRPRLAILDEPTSGLDVLNALEIRSMLKGLAADGMSILLSSHNMLEIEFLSTRMAIIDRGALLALGTAEDLKRANGCANLEEVFSRLAGDAPKADA